MASLVWEKFGDVRNFVEPFFGSGAVLLARPQPFEGAETINDADGFVSNFWRALQADSDAVAKHADWPVNELDLHARHLWLVNEGRKHVERLREDAEYYNAKIAGWWVWGLGQWIGGGWCKLQHRRRPHLGAGMGVHRPKQDLFDYLRALSERLRRVRVCCGDWSRVCGPTPTVLRGLTAVFLDPPYSAEAGRDNAIYAVEDLTVAHEVRAWCLANGDDKRMRIALCGYEGEGHEELETAGWECVAWKAQGGYAHNGDGETAGKDNAKRERIWFSPHCVRESGALFDNAE